MVVQILQQVAVFLQPSLKPVPVFGAEFIDDVDVSAGYPIVLCHNMKYTEMTAQPTWHSPASELSVGDEGEHEVGGVLVEVVPAVVGDRGRAGIGVARDDLHLAKRDTCVQGRHDETGSEDVGYTGPSPARLPLARTQR
jgi:hypothetical protein